MKITVSPPVGVARSLPRAEPQATEAARVPGKTTGPVIDWHPLAPPTLERYRAYASAIVNESAAGLDRISKVLKGETANPPAPAEPDCGTAATRPGLAGNIPIDAKTAFALGLTMGGLKGLAGLAQTAVTTDWRSHETDVSFALCDIERNLPIVLWEFLAYQALRAYSSIKLLWLEHPAFDHVMEFDIKHTRGFCFLYQGRAHIAFRGTQDAVNWMRNFQVCRTRATPFRHRGFVNSLAVAKPTIDRWLDSLPASRDGGKPPLVLTGHSLGGAMAILAAYDYAVDRRNVAAVVTFGAPAVGKEDFVDKYNDLLGGRTWRVESSNDIVPRLCHAFGYRHVGRNYALEDDHFNQLTIVADRILARAVGEQRPPTFKSTNVFGKNPGNGFSVTTDSPFDRKSEEANMRGVANAANLVGRNPWIATLLFTWYGLAAVTVWATTWTMFEWVRRNAAHRYREQYALPLSRVIGLHLLTDAELEPAVARQVFDSHLRLTAGWLSHPDADKLLRAATALPT